MSMYVCVWGAGSRRLGGCGWGGGGGGGGVGGVGRVGFKPPTSHTAATWLAQLGESVGRASVCRAGGLGFKPWPGQHSGSLNN